MEEIAARLNRALRQIYGLDHDVFTVEPDDRDGKLYRLLLIDSEDLGTMHHFAMDIEHLCGVYADSADYRPDQLRLF